MYTVMHKDRITVRASGHAELLGWLEQAASQARPDQAVAAVLALRRALAAPLAQAASLLAPHEEALAGMAVVRQWLDRAQAEAEAHNANRARDALDQVEAQLRAGALRTARRALLGTQPFLGPDERKRAEDLEQRIAERERLEEPTLHYKAALERGDLVEAREQAARVARLARGEEAEAWNARRRALVSRIRAEWRIHEEDLDPDTLGPELKADTGMWLDVNETPSSLLADNGATLLLVSVFERWIFLREVDVERSRLKRMGWLRTPEPLGSTDVQVMEDALYLCGEQGLILQLSRRPLDVARWISLRPFMLPDHVVQNPLLIPPGRLLWANFKDPGEACSIAAIDLHEWRVQARLHQDSSFVPVSGAQPARVLANDLGKGPSHLYDERGKRLAWKDPPSGHALSMVAHPGGKGWLAMVALHEGGKAYAADEELPIGLVEMVLGRPPSAPLIVPEADSDGWFVLAVALECKRAFLLTSLDRRYVLASYAPGAKGIEREWQVEVPGHTILVQDAAARKVVAVVPSAHGFACHALGDKPPRVTPDPGTNVEVYRARHDAGCRGRDDFDQGFGALLDELYRHAQEGGLERFVEVLRRERRRDPAALACLVKALLYIHRDRLAEPLLKIASDQHPQDPLLKLCWADLAASRRQWEDVERYLDALEVASLPLPEACHFHHLGGLARLHAGDPAGAHRRFMCGAKLSPAACQVAWHLELAGALCDPPNGSPEAADSPLRAFIRTIRHADVCLATGAPAQARDLLQHAMLRVPSETQSTARLAEACLAFEPTRPSEIFQKAIALARFVAVHHKKVELKSNLPGLGWNDERVGAVAERAGAWLERFQQPEGVDIPAAPPPPEKAAPAPAEDRPATPAWPKPHSLPPLGHEVMSQLVPGLDAVVRESVRRARELPGWDDTQVISSELGEFGPVRHFLRGWDGRAGQ